MSVINNSDVNNNDYKDENTWLMLGDCLERMKEIPDGSVDMVLTDIPYGTTQCKWDSIIDLHLMWDQLNRVTKEGGAVVLFGIEPFSSSVRNSNVSNFKYDWVWNKVKPSGHLNAKRMPMCMVENVMVFNCHHSNYKPQMTKQKPRVSESPNKHSEVYGSQRKVSKVIDTKHPNQIITMSNANQRGKVHPTQKPVALMEYLINTYTNEGETVLDFTFGSNTTGVACKNLARKYIGIEMDETYFNIGKERMLNDN